MRIVSLLPSATETICLLGLGDQLVGVTHECDHPPFVRGLPKLTETRIPSHLSSAEIDAQVRAELAAGEERSLYRLDRAALERAAPDLVVTQTLCDVCAVAESEVQAATCSLPGRPRVLNLEPQTLEEVLKSIRTLADAAGVSKRGMEVVAALRQRVAAVRLRTSTLRPEERPRALLLEWIDPPFSCGHWSPQLVEWAGGVEGLGRLGCRSRTLAWNEVFAWNPEVVVVAACGFDVARTRQDLRIADSVPGWKEMEAVRTGRVHLVDGSQFFSRPGPRLVDSLEMLAHALHPSLHPLPPGVPAAEPAYPSR